MASASYGPQPVFDTSKVRELAAELEKTPGRSVSALTVAVKKNTEALRAGWVANARVTSGLHGAHYPDSITGETRTVLGAIIGEVGPDVTRKGGAAGMGYEFGSVHQPPHLDGNRAADIVEDAFENDVANAIAAALGNL